MEPEQYSILSFLNEDPGLIPIFASISAYLSEDQLSALRTSKGLRERTKTINQEPLYWKERVENWFGVFLHDHKVDWKRIYLELMKEEARLRSEIKRSPTRKKEDLKSKYGKITPDNFSPLLIAEDLAAKNDDVKLIKIILDVLRNETNEQITSEINYIVGIALLEDEHWTSWKIINFLIDMVTNVDLKIEALKKSIRSKQQFELIKKLIEDPQLKDALNYDDLLYLAIEDGNEDVTELLLEEYPVHPEANNNETIIRASRYGFENIVELLLNDTRVDPTARNNKAIRRAVEYDRWAVVAVLFNDKRVHNSLNDEELIKKIKNTLLID
jgi:hypothetical protein